MSEREKDSQHFESLPASILDTVGLGCFRVSVWQMGLLDLCRRPKSWAIINFSEINLTVAQDLAILLPPSRCFYRGGISHMQLYALFLLSFSLQFKKMWLFFFL